MKQWEHWSIWTFSHYWEYQTLPIVHRMCRMLTKQTNMELLQFCLPKRFENTRKYLIEQLAQQFKKWYFVQTNRQLIYFTGVTILLSLTVFLNMVAETMPATSDAVPLLGKVVWQLWKAIQSIYRYKKFTIYALRKLNSLSLGPISTIYSILSLKCKVCIKLLAILATTRNQNLFLIKALFLWI